MGLRPPGWQCSGPASRLDDSPLARLQSHQAVFVLLFGPILHQGHEMAPPPVDKSTSQPHWKPPALIEGRAGLEPTRDRLATGCSKHVDLGSLSSTGLVEFRLLLVGCPTRKSCSHSALPLSYHPSMGTGFEDTEYIVKHALVKKKATSVNWWRRVKQRAEDSGNQRAPIPGAHGSCSSQPSTRLGT